MHPLFAAGTATIAVLVFPILPSLTNAQSCAAGSAQEINGNWYCSEVRAITYNNFPGHGYYNKVTDMDASNGQCTSEQYGYSGSLSPLNEELSLHVRGPTWLKQVAVYIPTTITSKKRSAKRSSPHDRRHGGHQYLHHADHSKLEEVPMHKPLFGKRAVGDIVSATIDGQLVSWTNEYAEPGVATNTPSPVAVNNDEAVTSTPDTTSQTYGQSVTPVPTAAAPEKVALPPAAASSNPTTSSSASGGSWSRQAYYNAEAGTAQGLTFLNHFGGANGIPGTAAGGPAFGASLSYASSDGQSGAQSSKVLSDAMIGDDTKVIVLSDKSCNDGGCGYTRPGGVSYHGFSGSQKLFLLEFSMPSTNETGFNADMPAIWLMNAQIPLTSQYGTNPECSCWTSGCGEFDIFEALDSGNFRCKSTLHMAPAGGSSDWFMRPTGGSIIAAVLFAGGNEVAAIRVLHNRQRFDGSLSSSLINEWVGEQSSTFNMEER